MRLHRLTMTAFGPFPHTVSVDFEALTADGLFLIHGDTGAGKTTILDGICFALYGSVPGFRDDAKSLHSQHAAVGVGPRVELDVTLTNRRLLISRSPEWMRPRRRGSGTTRQQALVEIVEQLPDRIEFVTREHREAADLIRAETGLDVQQFCQVVLLPQGGFARFLQASADDRQGLLRRLFDIEIFTRAEGWLAEHRTQLGQQERAALGTIRDLTQRFAEVVKVEVPADLDKPDTLSELDAWAAVHRNRAADLVEALAQNMAVGTAEEQRLDQVRQAAATLARQQREYQAAVQQRDELTTRKPERDRWKRQLDSARAAATLKPYLDQVDRRHTDLDLLRRTTIEHLASLPADVAVLPDRIALTVPDGGEAVDVAGLDVNALTRAEQTRTTQLRAAEAAIDSEARRTTLRGQRTAVGKKLEDLAGRSEKVNARLVELPVEHAEITGRREQALAVAADREAAELRLDEAQKQAKACKRRDDLTARLATAEEERRTAVDRHQAAEARHLDVRQRRLAGMAAELAGELRPGQPCGVCGSPEHPEPAQAAADAVSAADEDHAKTEAGELLDERRSAEVTVERINAQLNEVTETVGDLTAAHARSTVTEARKAVRAATEATKLADELGAHLETLDVMLADQHREAADIGRDEAVANAQQAALTAQITELDESIDAVRGQDKTLRARVTRLTGELAEVRTAATNLGQWLQAGRELADAHREAQHHLHLSEFADTVAARAAALTDPEIVDLQERIDAFDGEYHQAAGRAQDPTLLAAAHQPSPDVEGSEQTYQAARLRATELHAQHGLAVEQHDRLKQLGPDLVNALAQWRPIRAEYEIANRLAQLVEGKSSDSGTRMTLSTYVLTHRFRHVVTAANTRLGQVTHNRYLLRHVTESDTGRRAGRNGLGLSVVDAWTGQERRPATLSGGETFLVSLCLALGLSDVVLAEAGGTQLGSLFVDEGFGTLDQEALDQVLDALDGLRSGGRTVGLVSHVAELRRRIPSRLYVRKTATGSTVAVETQAID
ncbi:AAA family ATPase [Micromonospora sp. RL09-050-HVF-A]|uniref:AAA family ATPase n=1 Tax=Micromonospora sp. RL09-050-HVF-A TaxID=1703433 RepID=UPI001C5CFE40|nr:SMC family ATPase [Micromonospora sp. RL09-050-HVF-A]MBW4702084.1 SMC family ATPase [Micromonospora sp. RL09-050-HVF-A]